MTASMLLSAAMVYKINYIFTIHKYFTFHKNTLVSFLVIVKMCKFNLNVYGGPILMSYYDVVDKVIIVKITFLVWIVMIWTNLNSNGSYIIHLGMFKMESGRHFADATISLTESDTASWPWQRHVQYSRIHFSFCFESIAKKLSEIWRIQNLTRLWLGDLVSWPTFPTNKLARTRTKYQHMAKFRDEQFMGSLGFGE